MSDRIVVQTDRAVVKINIGVVSSVTSVFGRTGAVVATSSDYSAYYQPLDAQLSAIAALTPAAYDITYWTSLTAAAQVSANVTTTRKFLRMTGTGSAGQAPVWDTLVIGDIPNLSSLYAAAGSTGSTNLLVYDSGGVAGGNVYTTAATLFAAAQAIDGPVEIFLRTDLTIAAAFEMSWEWKFVADSANQRTVTFANGAQVTGQFPSFWYDVDVNVTATTGTAIFTVTAGNDVYLVTRYSSWGANTGAIPLFLVNASSVNFYAEKLFRVLAKNTPLISLTNSSQCSLNLDATTEFQLNDTAISGATSGSSLLIQCTGTLPITVDSSITTAIGGVTYTDAKGGWYAVVNASAGSATIGYTTHTSQQGAFHVLTDAATISWDTTGTTSPIAKGGREATVTLGGNRTLATPTRAKRGGLYLLRVVQDATGGRTLTFPGTFSGFPAPTTTANAVTMYLFTYDGTTYHYLAPGGSGSSYTAGDGLSLSGSDFSVNVDNVTLQISSDTVKEKEELPSSNATGSVTLDLSTGRRFRRVLTGDVTFTFSNPTAGAQYELVLAQDGTGGREVTFPTTCLLWTGVRREASGEVSYCFTYDDTATKYVRSGHHERTRIITGTTHTATPEDHGTLLVCTHASGCTVTLPALTAGYHVAVLQQGGAVAIARAGSDTIYNSLTSITTSGDGHILAVYGGSTTWLRV